MNELHPSSESHVYATFVFGNSDRLQSYPDLAVSSALAALFSHFIPKNHISFYCQDKSIANYFDPQMIFKRSKDFYQFNISEFQSQFFEFNEEHCIDDEEAILYIFFIDHGGKYVFGSAQHSYFHIINRLFSKFKGKEIIIANDCCYSGTLISATKISYQFDSLISEYTANQTYKEVLLLIIVHYQYVICGKEVILSEINKASNIDSFDKTQSDYFDAYYISHSTDKEVNSSEKISHTVKQYIDDFKLEYVPTFKLLSSLFKLSIPFSTLTDSNVIKLIHEIFDSPKFTHILNEINNVLQEDDKIISHYIPCCTFPENLTIITSSAQNSSCAYYKHDLVPVQKHNRCYSLSCGSPFDSTLIDDMFFQSGPSKESVSRYSIINNEIKSNPQFYQNHEYDMHKFPPLGESFNKHFKSNIVDISKIDIKGYSQQKEKSKIGLPPLKYSKNDSNHEEYKECEEHEELLDDPILRYLETPEELINRINSYSFRPNEPIPDDVNSLADIEDTNFLILFCQRFNKYLKENGLPPFLLNGPAENHPNGRGLFTALINSCDHYYTMLYMNYHFPKLIDVFSTYFYNNHDKIRDIVHYFLQSIIDIKDRFNPAYFQHDVQLIPEITLSVESYIKSLEREFKQAKEK